MRKADAPVHGAALTPMYLDYARQDVAATWALYQAERTLYKRHGVRKHMWSIYSEASLGKAYFETLGVPRFTRQHPDFPPEVMGYALTAYYGGRSEVKIRLQPTEVIYTDFKSQYPTVNALMDLQDLLLAARIEVRQGAEVATEVRAWLALVVANGPDELHSSAAWQRLRCLVKVRPEGDILPVRATYGPSDTNIGLPFVTGLPVWYTLADVAASTLLTGKAPEVLEALELVPVGRVETRPLDLFGDPRYRIDLNERDLFTGVIDLRGAVITELKQVRQAAAGARDPAKKAHLEAEATRLEALQLALKLLANSTSYGVLVEVMTAEERARPTPVTVYGMDTRGGTTRRLEKPGSYFVGAVGTLIPAGGRLLLALAERLAADRGIGYALCDTDSVTFARPEGMERAAFEALVGEVCAWFTPLSPYRGQPPLLEREDVNDWGGQPEPLYALCVSAKRYALYNRLADGTYRIRKFSSHGVGTWQGRDGYTQPPHVPEPCIDVHKLANGAGERWAYDLWYDAITAIDGGSVERDTTGEPLYRVPPAAWLDQPAFHQLTISTARLYHAYDTIPGVRPFGFITTLPPLDAPLHDQREVDELMRAFRHLRFDALSDAEKDVILGRIPEPEDEDEDGDGGGGGADEDEDGCTGTPALYTGQRGVAYYAPYARTAADLHDVRRVTDHVPVPVGLRHKTVAECLDYYYTHGEWKAAAPHGVGLLPRRHVRTVEHISIGKEVDPIRQEDAADTLGAVPDAPPQEYGRSGLAGSLRAFEVADLVQASGVPRMTIVDVVRGATPTPTVRDKLRAGLAVLTTEPGRTLVGWRNVPRAYLADRLGVPVSDVQKMRNGTRCVSEQERAVLIVAVRQWCEEHGVRATPATPPGPPRPPPRPRRRRTRARAV